jgi:CSLREA domain-containing protein
MESKKNFFIAVIVSVVMLSIVYVPVTYAKRFVVDTTVDDVDANPGDGICDTGDSVCSLRAAIEEANAWNGRDRIKIPAGNYILKSFSNGLEITDDLVIRGKDADQTIIDANRSIGGFWIIGDIKVVIKKVAVTGACCESGIANRGGRLTISNCEIEGNWGNDGGGIDNYNGYLKVKKSKISNNDGEWGGGINSFGNNAELTISDSLISGNAGYGAGGISNGGGILKIYRSEIIDNDGWQEGAGGIGNWSYEGFVADATIKKSTIARNHSSGWFGGGGFGGGIHNRGDMVIINSDISDNTADYVSPPPEGWGGGILNEGTLLIRRSTISGNETGTGGGIYNSADLTVIKSVITENTALASGASGGGIYNDGTVTLKKTIIENNVPDDCVNCQ